MKLAKGKYYSRLLFVFVVLSCVGITGALQARNAYAAADDTGGGDIVRQIAYILFALAAAAPFFSGFGRRLLKSVPGPVFLLLVWCAITLAWSPVPLIGLRRLLLTVVVVFSCFAITDQLEPLVALRAIWRGLVFLMILSLLTCILMPMLGVHQPGDPEVEVIGDWRGVFYHKNILGAVASFSMLTSLHLALGPALDRKERRLRGMARLAVLLSLFLLVMSKSKTSLALALVSAGVLVVLHAFRSRSRKIIVAGFVSSVVSMCLVLIYLPVIGYGLKAIFLSPDAFTGRGFIWQMLLEVASKHSLLGIGYQSVFQVGQASALVTMSNDRFFDTLSHAHNGYLELYVSIGTVGLLLALPVLILAPIRWVTRPCRALIPFRPVLFAVFVFVLIHGVLESGFLDRDRPTWLMFMLACGVARAAVRNEKLGLVPSGGAR